MTEQSPAGDKLQKLLAQAGMGSRREMEKVIAEGRVKVNGVVARLGDRATDRDKISMDGKFVTIAEQDVAGRVLIYNKPEAEICSRSDPEGRRTVFESLPKVKTGRWIAVGRLDFNTTGLMLFTTDGALANALMHPSSAIDREYLCRVLGQVDDALIKRLTDGVLLEDGVAKFTDVVDGGGEGANHWYYVALMEGRNREVRRLWESQEIQVSRLKRVRFGKIFLPARLRQGQWDEMPFKEVQELYAMVGMTAEKPAKVQPKERENIERQQRKNRGIKRRQK
ncbi:23S rRNA pseudouridine(2605) synthase RluB [Oceanicoccus sp. KOV_DT_Chl]|uniref:23S rRNA pseudouridine(2605) synthase RluB n=1 Tax=Oceanicoccus sp. KOV_DT_Chl TaxID=1904639 RepID=UPI000C79FE63|nr:pseudouridine synthase [Oceanicoccus sp. KOV_DT_Chl]